MKISKITKFLPVVMALALATTGVYADDQKHDSTAEYNLTLNDYIKITTPTVPTGSTVSYGTDYVSATIDNPVVGVFQVISNNREQTLYLKASCPTSGGDGKVGGTSALYGANADCSALKVVFTKTDVPPAATAVTNITGGSASMADNPDAIAFPMTIALTHQHTVEGDDTGTLPAATWDTNRVKYVMKNGVATFTCTVDGSNEPQTFNTRDTDGTYQATLTLTESDV